MIEGSVRWLERVVPRNDDPFYLIMDDRGQISKTMTVRVLQQRHVEWYLPGGAGTGGTGGDFSLVPFEGFLQRWSEWQDVPVVTG